jgi:hypothetical protein
MRNLTMLEKLMLAAAGCTVIAAFLPWVSFLGVTASGINGDGRLTLGLAIVGGAGLVLGRGGWIMQLAVGGSIAAIALYDTNNAGSLAAVGLYATLASGVAWMVGSLLVRRGGAATTA